MKNKLFKFLLAVFMIVGGLSLSAQNKSTVTPQDYANYPYWSDMMQDQNANFYEIQRAFYTYFEGRETGRGTGYKPFKRWEYFWESRVNPDGTFPAPDQIYNAFNQYVQDHPVSDRLKTGNPVWQELGPKTRVNYGGYTGVGRVNAIAFHPTDTATVYVGAPSGGFWITHDSGKTWSSATDTMPTLGVSAILVSKTNPNQILIGTGDRDSGDSPGMGVYRSDDGGLTWIKFNNGMGNVTVGMMARAESNERLILAATSGGIFKTLDGGETWTRTSPDQAHYKDIKFRPGSSTVAYAVAGGNFLRSTDGGSSWTLVPHENGYPSGGRAVIGVSKANDSLVYLVNGGSKFEGCFLSRDFGQSFTTTATTPNILGYNYDGSDAKSQASYDLMIHIDPYDAQKVFVGGINIWKSLNGGKNWQIIAHWTGDRTNEVHADQHTFACNPLNNRIYAGNDGGIYCTDNEGTKWKEISEGLGIGQLYKIGLSNTDGNKMTAGFQDNGSATWLGTSWMDTGGGDGMECAVDPFDNRYSYTTIYYGSINRYINNASGRKVAAKGVNGITEDGAWVTPFLLSEGDGNTMVIGYKNVWICRNIKTATTPVWTKISNNLGNSNSVNMSVLEQSPANFNLLYAVRSDSKIFRTENLLDGNVLWTNLTDCLPVAATPSDVECHPYDPNTVYMLLSRNIYKSTNKGAAWVDISGSLPSINMNSLVFDKTSDEGIYIGTDAGVYYKDASMADWVLYGLSLPVNVEVSEVEIFNDPRVRSESRLRASTYGRGVWQISIAPSEALLPPSMLTATTTDTDVDLSWTPPFYEQNIIGYRVYRNGVLLDMINGNSYTDQDLEKDITYTYKVCALYTGNQESSFSNEAYATIIAEIELPYTQTFESGTAGYTALLSPEGWKYGTAESLVIPGRDGHFFAANSSTAGAGVTVKDYLITPQIDLSAFTGKTITLEFAYTMRRYRTYDKFNVNYRVAPDSAWVKLVDMNPPSVSAWKWDTTQINLPEKALTRTAQLGFFYDNSNEFAWGAAVDDIQLYVNTTSSESLDNQITVNVYPNPSQGLFNIELPSGISGDITLQVISITGQVVFEKILSNHAVSTVEKIDLSTQPKGVYQLLIRAKSNEWKQKITVQ